MRAYGATEEQIAERLGDRDGDEEVCEVWPENAPALEMFLALRTQWRVGAMGGVLGLDYQGMLAVFRVRRIKDQAAMLADLQVMEAAATPVLNRKDGDV